MGLFGNTFKKKGNNSNKKVVIDETIDIKNERDFLLDVLSNLGLLSLEKIKKSIPAGEVDLFDRLIIDASDDDFSYLKKYYGSYNLGYGVEKVEILKNKFDDLSNAGIMQGLTKKEILNKLVDITNKEIDNYKTIISNLDKEIKELEETNKDKDINTIVEFYIRKYKEEDLGYPINLYNSVIEMATDLCTLEYGGYGEEEVNKFVDAARKIIDEDREKGVITSHTLDKIKRELYNPRKRRYLADVETLKKKIEMVDESTYISDMEKEQNKFKIISDFQQMNGHVFSIDKTISTMKGNLSNLAYDGYGEIVIDKFDDYCQDIRDKAKEDGLSDIDIIKKIQQKYDNLIKEFEVHLNKLKEGLDKATGESIKEDLIEDFHDLMGHIVDYKERLAKYREGLTNLEYGGYPKKVVDDLLNEAEEKVEIIASNDELSNYLKQIRRKFRELLDEYNKELEKLKADIEKVKNSKRKDESTINKEIDILVMNFKAKFGYPIDYNEIVEANTHDLQNLDGGGYGKKVLDSYRDYCEDIIENTEESDQIFKKIQAKYKELKKNYNDNLKVFTEWKRLQLKNKSGQEKEELEKDLDTKITYMLSLSPEDLYDYYMEDDRKKKAEAYKHNYLAAFRYLAKEESKKKKNKALYDKRLDELKDGKVIYSQKDIDEAIRKLETSTLNNDDVKEEDRIIGLIEYVDSTLFRQMLYVESSLNIRNN